MSLRVSVQLSFIDGERSIAKEISFLERSGNNGGVGEGVTVGVMVVGAARSVISKGGDVIVGDDWHASTILMKSIVARTKGEKCRYILQRASATVSTARLSAVSSPFTPLTVALRSHHIHPISFVLFLFVGAFNRNNQKRYHKQIGSETQPQ